MSVKSTDFAKAHYTVKIPSEVLLVVVHMVTRLTNSTVQTSMSVPRRTSARKTPYARTLADLIVANVLKVFKETSAQ